MPVELLFISKILLVIIIWFLIAACFIFLLLSQAILKKLKHFEILCITKKDKILRDVLPCVLQYSNYNKNLHILINYKKTPLKDLMLTIVPLLFTFFTLANYLKLSTNFIDGIKKRVGLSTKAIV